MNSKIFKNEKSDMEIEFYDKLEYCTIFQKDKIETQVITLGIYPNERWKLLEKALTFAKRHKARKSK